MSTTYQTILVLAALAIVIAFIGQTVAMFLIYGMIKKLDAKAAEMQTRLTPVLDESKATLVKTNRVIDEVSLEVRACVAAVSATTVELSRMTLEQASELTGFIDDATSSARYQIG